MTITPPKCWFFINQHQRNRALEALEQKASKLFLESISGNDYGKGISTFRFDVYVEPEINFGRHRDTIHTGCAQLSIHVDKETFDNATDDIRTKLLLNAALVLLKYLTQRVTLPKGFQAEKLTVDFESYLATESLLLSQEQLAQTMIKPFDRLKFSFAVSTTAEVKDSEIHYDLNDVKNFINNKLVGQSFGASVRQFHLGYEIADPKGHMPHHPETANISRYGIKNKDLLVVKQFDYNELKGLDLKGQFQILKSKILEAISDVGKMSKKPKDFDEKKFLEVMRSILADYEKGHSH